jgi:hypothetical protein
MSQGYNTGKEETMKKLNSIFIFLLSLSFVTIYLGYAQSAPLANPPVNQPCNGDIKTCDVNHDGKSDVTYYSDGKYVTKVEADTNSDGKPEIVEHIKDGKFESAEVDTNNDGKMEKKFTNKSEFNKWLNENSPDYKDKLDQPDWTFEAIKF